MLLLLAVAFLIPKVEDRRMSDAQSVADENRQQFGLDYARERLWNDFRELRRNGESGLPSSSPTLDEYRGYLSSYGLLEPGDAVTLYVVSPSESARGVEKIKVVLESDPSDLALSVAIADRNRSMPAGALHIQLAEADSLRCELEPLADSRMWSLWPFTPQPLLP